MNYRITEDWLTDVYEILFGFFDEEEVRKLEIPAFEDENPAEIAAQFYAKRSHEVIRANMDYIPTDTRITVATLEREASERKASRVKGYLLHYKLMNRSEKFGTTEMSELWLLEDGRLAEVTSVCYLKGQHFHIHRKFRKIIKHKKDIWFSVFELEDALALVCIAGMGCTVVGCQKLWG